MWQEIYTSSLVLLQRRGY